MLYTTCCIVQARGSIPGRAIAPTGRNDVGPRQHQPNVSFTTLTSHKPSSLPEVPGPVLPIFFLSACCQHKSLSYAFHSRCATAFPYQFASNAERTDVIHLIETYAKVKQRPEPLSLQNHRAHDWFCRDCGNGSMLSVCNHLRANCLSDVVDSVLAGFAVLLLLCDRCGQEVSAPNPSVTVMLIK
jgi:hypothetical protein